jgi:ADP-ribose pyrophosphatase YjhB (NUDIX family)
MKLPGAGPPGAALAHLVHDPDRSPPRLRAGHPARASRLLAHQPRHDARRSRRGDRRARPRAADPAFLCLGLAPAGGGVEPGETMLAALTRELREEGGIELDGAPVLHGVFFNGHVSRRDHVALYVVRNFRQVVVPKPNFEIVAHGFFPRDALPEATTASTRARLDEIFDGRPVSETW